MTWPNRTVRLIELRILDGLGRKVMVNSQASEKGWEIQSQGLAKGTYHLVGLDDQGRVARASWVIEE